MERFLQTYCDSLFNLLSVFANKDNGIRFFNFFFASGIGFDNYPVWCTYFTYNLQMQKICMFLYFKIQWFMSIFNLNKQYFYFMCRSMFYFYDDLKINNGFWRKRTHINQFINHVPIYSFVFCFKHTSTTNSKERLFWKQRSGETFQLCSSSDTVSFPIKNHCINFVHVY